MNHKRKHTNVTYSELRMEKNIFAALPPYPSYNRTTSPSLQLYHLNLFTIVPS